MAEPRRFAYYERLTAKQKATYRKSDAAASITIPDPAGLISLVAKLEEALASGKRTSVAAATTALSAALLSQLAIENVKIRVRIVRPQLDDGELHGLYTFAHDGEPPKLEVWMRTAAQAKVVRFRTFFRTLMHELAHHLDVTLLGLEDSFHTEGFFRRESSLVRQLAPAERRSETPMRPTRDAERPKPLESPRQLSLF